MYTHILRNKINSKLRILSCSFIIIHTNIYMYVMWFIQKINNKHVNALYLQRKKFIPYFVFCQISILRFYQSIRIILLHPL